MAMDSENNSVEGDSDLGDDDPGALSSECAAGSSPTVSGFGVLTDGVGSFGALVAGVGTACCALAASPAQITAVKKTDRYRVKKVTRFISEPSPLKE